MSRRGGSFEDDRPSKRFKPGLQEDGQDDSVYDGDPEELLNEQYSGEVESEAGIVESIELKNFMCHSHLGPFTFGPNINFIVGKNGSGKSAILTALIVALGGNAQATNRGLALKGFVKHGESSAEVSVTLRNRGRDAYKPAEYGSSIIVEMKITREGVRTYKLRSSSGKVVSSKKVELISILNSFNIQVNNPMSILTQEMSKTFLHSKREQDKYEFFMEATQLKKMKHNCVYTKTNKAITQDKIDQLCESLNDLKQKYQEKEEQYKNLASLDEMEAKLEELQKKMAWALVTEMEKALEPKKEELQLSRNSTQKYDEKVEEWKNKVQVAENKQRGTQEQLDTITQQISGLQARSGELKVKVQERKRDFRSSEVTVHRCKANLRDLEKDKAQLSSRIEDLKISISQTTGEESQVRMQQMNQMEAELENLRHHISTLDQQIDQYQQACSLAREEHGKIRRERDLLNRAMDANRRNLRTQESSRSNRLQRFGEHMPALLSAIEDAHRRGQFKQKPRGPLGFLISLKDQELALAVEVCLKSLLLAFTCDNFHDERVLLDIMARVFVSGHRPTVITSKFFPRVHDTRRRAVNHPDYPSVLQALEIEDPVVANCLIDQRGIESVLLIKNKTEARRVMQGARPPQNCTQAFSKEGDQVFHNRSYTAEQTRAQCLSRDVEEEIRHLQMELDNQRAQVDHLDQQLRKIDEQLKQNDVLLRRSQAEQKKAKDNATKLELELTDLRNTEEPQSEDLRPLEEDLQEIVVKISAERAQHEKARAQMAKDEASYNAAEQEYQQHKASISSVAEEADAKKEELSKIDQELMKCKHHKKHYEEKRKAHLQGIHTLEATVQSDEQELQASVEKATQICPERLEVTQTPRRLDNEITRLKTKIATQQQQHGNRDVVVRQYHAILEKYKADAQQVKHFRSFMKRLNRLTAKRIFAFTMLRQFLSVRCKYYFHTMLAQRGYTGKILFDHKVETLSISVQTTQGEDTEMRDVRCLSGGERSFSTVCFVLALWYITEAPFRALDEFDVFMDMVNRRISMDMMLKVAASQRFRQFIFLTPQYMSTLPKSSLIRILQLKDPDRSESSQGDSSGQ